MPSKQIKALKKASQKRKKEALKKTEKAIKDLIKKKEKITIRSVARKACVSVSYIYKYPELSSRIQSLRAEQKSHPVKSRSPEKSSQIITNQLASRIKILEQEKQELSQEITILNSNVSAMGNSDNLVERLQAENIRLLEENKKLRKQLANTEKKLVESREFILTQGAKYLRPDFK